MESSANVLQQRARIQLASVMVVTVLGVSVPGTVRVSRPHTGPAVLLTSAPLHRHGLHLVVAEHHQPGLAAVLGSTDQQIVDRHVEREDLHLLHQLGPGALLVSEGDQLEDSAPSGAGEQNINLLSGGKRDGGVHSYGGQSLVRTGLDEVRPLHSTGHGPVHQSVLLDEVEVLVVQLTGVVVTGPGPTVGLVVPGEREPVGVDVRLPLEGTVEAVEDVAHLETADGAPGDGVLRRVEDPEDGAVLPLGVDHPGHGLDLVEVEGVGAGDGAVEPGLGEGGPLVLEGVRPSVVLLTDSAHPTVDRLNTPDINTVYKHSLSD